MLLALIDLYPTLDRLGPSVVDSYLLSVLFHLIVQLRAAGISLITLEPGAGLHSIMIGIYLVIMTWSRGG